MVVHTRRYSELSLCSKFDIITLEQFRRGLEDDVERGLNRINSWMLLPGFSGEMEIQNLYRWKIQVNIMRNFLGRDQVQVETMAKGFNDRYHQNGKKRPNGHTSDQMNNDNPHAGNNVSSRESCSTNPSFISGAGDCYRNSTNIIFDPYSFSSDIVWRTDPAQPEFIFIIKIIYKKLIFNIINYF